jgi:hypothetical protein
VGDDNNNKKGLGQTPQHLRANLHPSSTLNMRRDGVWRVDEEGGFITDSLPVSQTQQRTLNTSTIRVFNGLHCSGMDKQSGEGNTG